MDLRGWVSRITAELMPPLATLNTPASKLEALMAWQRANLITPVAHSGFYEVEDILKSGVAWCDQASLVFCRLAKELFAIKTEQRWLQHCDRQHGHIVAEAYYDNAWHLYDPSYEYPSYYQDKVDGHVLSYSELAYDQSSITVRRVLADPTESVGLRWRGANDIGLEGFFAGPKRTCCPACTSTEIRGGQAYDGHFWNRCANCGALWQRDDGIRVPRCLVDNGQLDRSIPRTSIQVLPDDDYTAWQAEIIERARSGDTTPWHAQYDYIESRLIASGADMHGVYVEIGCGAGEMLDYAKARGTWQRMAGFDIVPEFVASVRARGHEVHYNDVSLGHHPFKISPLVQDLVGSCDVIVANEVMEHVTDPVNFLQGVRRYLAPGGQLWVKFARDLACDKLKNHEWQYWSATAAALVVEKADLRVLSMRRMPSSYDILACLPDDVPQVMDRRMAWNNI